MFNENKQTFIDFPNTAYYSPVSYAPQATAVFISKHLFTTVNTAYYLGRIAACLVWISLITWAIKIIPFHKWTLACLALLLMNLYISNSFSADTVSNGLCFVFVALLLRFILEESYLITRKRIALIVTLCMLIVLAKVVYIGLVVLILAIPQKRFQTATKRLVVIMFILSFSFLVMFIWSNVIKYYYTPYSKYNTSFRINFGLSNCANYDLQKEYILTHGTYFFKVIYRSIFDHPLTYLKSYIGQLGQFDIFFSDWIWILAYCIIFLVIGLDKSELSLSRKQRALGVLAVFVAFVLLLLSQHLTWDCVGEGIVDLIQGRYLIPIFPLLFIVLFKYRVLFNFKPIWILMPFIFSINGYALIKIHARFHKETESKKVAFYSSLEKEKDGAFLTSYKYCTLKPTNQKTTKTSFSGKQSVMLSPSGAWQEFGCNYEFINTENTLYFQLEAMVKGKGIRLVLSGEDSDGKPIYLASSYESTSFKDDWQRISIGTSIFNPSKTKKFNIYAWNTSKDTAYIDDFRFEYRGYKTVDF